jgi:hypothetical protein
MMTIESNCFAKLSSFLLPYIDWKLSIMQPVRSYLQKERLLLLERFTSKGVFRMSEKSCSIYMIEGQHSI